MSDIDQHDEYPLPPEILSGLAADRLPEARVERGVVRRLQTEGVLRSPRQVTWHRARPVLIAALAASIAFVAGMRAGERRAEAGRGGAVQVAGEQYAAALSRVQPGEDSATTAALTSFRLVVDQLHRLAPDDEDMTIIAAALDGSVLRGPLVARPATPSLVVWR